jgi:hypothetical protein
LWCRGDSIFGSQQQFANQTQARDGWRLPAHQPFLRLLLPINCLNEAVMSFAPGISNDVVPQSLLRLLQS